MVVCADQFFNETVQHADIVLPVTTAFEEWNVDASYWHYWLPLISRRLSRCMKQNATLKSLPCCRAPLIRWRRVPVPSRKSSITSVGWIRSSTTEWRKCSASLPGRSAGRAEKAILPSSAARYDRKFKTPSGKYEFKSELAEKTATPRCRNTNRKPRANCLPSVYAARAVWPALAVYQPDWMQVFYPEPFVYIHPSSAQKKASARTIWSKFSMAPVKLSCGQKSPPTCRKIFW